MPFFSGIRNNIAHLIRPLRAGRHSERMLARWWSAPDGPFGALSSLDRRDRSIARSRFFTVQDTVGVGAVVSIPMGAVGQAFVLEKIWFRMVTLTRFANMVDYSFVARGGPYENVAHAMQGIVMTERLHGITTPQALSDTSFVWGGALDVGYACHQRGLGVWVIVNNASGGEVDIMACAQVSLFSESREAF